jgi:hypothetical protein
MSDRSHTVALSVICEILVTNAWFYARIVPQVPAMIRINPAWWKRLAFKADICTRIPLVSRLALEQTQQKTSRFMSIKAWFSITFVQTKFKDDYINNGTQDEKDTSSLQTPAQKKGRKERW